MRIRINAPDQLNLRKLTAYVKDQLRARLSRYGDKVGQVTVWLQDLDGPQGDRRCFIRIKLDKRPKDIVLEVDAAEMKEAIDFATGRAGRAVQLALSPIKKP